MRDNYTYPYTKLEKELGLSDKWFTSYLDYEELESILSSNVIPWTLRRELTALIKREKALRAIHGMIPVIVMVSVASTIMGILHSMENETNN